MPVWFTRPLVEGDWGRDVQIAQRKLGLVPTGLFDTAMTLTVRGYQHTLGLPVTGVVDADTANEMGEQEGFGLLPSWFRPGIKPGDEEFFHVLELIGATPTDPDALKRFQGNHHLPPSGVVDETTARLLAGLEVE